MKLASLFSFRWLHSKRFGYAFGYRNPEKNQPAELTANEAEAIGRACYDPSAKEIALKGDKLAVSRAGLLAGAWLGRQQQRREPLR